MITLNYILQGFGFRDSHDFLRSSFGHTFSMLFIKMDVILSLLFATVHFLFGFNHLFLTAYVVLLIFEWITGVQASRKRGEKHESRKFGRMLLKIATYLDTAYLLRQCRVSKSWRLWVRPLSLALLGSTYSYYMATGGEPLGELRLFRLSLR